MPHEGQHRVIDMAEISIETHQHGLDTPALLADGLGNYTSVDAYEYTYDGLKLLNSGEPSRNDKGTIYIGLFRVISSTVKPFLMFCLYRGDDDVLSMGHIENTDCPGKKAENNMRKVFADWEGNIEYRGYVQHGCDTVVWLEYTDETIIMDQGKWDTRWWWVLSVEIVNQRRALSMEIAEEVNTFMEVHPQFLFLRDELGRLYETPAVGYYGSYAEHIAVTSVLGLRRKPPTSALGPYYYFSNYGPAIRYAVWNDKGKPMKIDGKLITKDDEGRYKRGGLVRFALFLGKTTMLLNRPTDKPDSSEKSRQEAKDNPAITAMLKLRDVDASWVYKYNSVQSPMLMSDSVISSKEQDSTFVCGNIQTIVKEYNQQIPLAYYYIDTEQDMTDLDTVYIE